MSYPDPGIAVQSQSSEVSGGVATLRITGEHTLQEAVDAVTAAIHRAKEQGIRKLLADLASVSGFDAPTLTARYECIGDWADAGRGHLRIAMVMRQEFMDPDRICVVRAANLGLDYNLFDSEERARAWLADPVAP